MEINTTPPIMETPTVAPASNRKKWIYSALAVVAIVGMSFFVVKNPQLFQASITPSDEVLEGDLYIPNYTAVAGDEGTITLKSNLDEDQANVSTISFTLKFEPVTALKFDANSLKLDNSTVFTSVDFGQVNTQVQGQVSVALYKEGGITIESGIQDLLKLSLQIDSGVAAGTEITLEAINVIVADATPTVINSLSTITEGSITVQSQDNLKLLRAEAVDATHVKLHFSDYLKNYVFDSSNYSINDVTIAASIVPGDGNGLQADQKSVVVPVSALTAGTEYTVQVTDLTGNTAGGMNDTQDAALFSYQTGVSDVYISQINVLSSTAVDLVMEGGVINADTVSPINILVKSFNEAGVASELQVTGATVQGNTIKLTTARQTGNANYFVIFNGVTDTAVTPLPLGNTAPMNFFGFAVPQVKIVSVTPETLTNDTEKNVTVIGENLDTVASARFNTTSVQITNKTSGTLTLVVPAGFTTGAYNLILTNSVGENISKDNALVVSVADRPMKIVSEESRATPNRVAPDGETKIKFWVLVEDPVDVSSVQSVIINLEQIGGSRSQEMAKDTATQPQFGQWYVYESTVSKQTPTQDAAYLLPIQARKGSQVVNGTVELTVSKDLYRSVAPTIDQVYFSPSTVPPDGKTPVKLSAKISDQDGADTITSVVANLGPVGAGFISLTRLDVSGTANEQVTGWYQSEDILIPTSVKAGDYTVAVSASDATGESATQTISLSVSTSATGPVIDASRTYVTPRQSLPKDGKTTFGLQAFVTDPDGLSDIVSVTADFRSMGLSPVTLVKAADAPADGKSARFGIDGLVIPTTSPFGVHEIEIVATDKSGADSNFIVKIDVTEKDTVGEPPIIFAEKSYTAPRVAINDGTTPISLYVFVRDDDSDLESVIVNLSQIGQVGPEVAPSFQETGAAAVPTTATPGAGTSAANPCVTGSNSIVCLTPSVKEGREGQWFVLSGVTISKNTSPSSEPYQVDIVATDKLGKTDRATLPISVFDGQSTTSDREPPKLVAAVATSPTTVEVAFNKELSASSITSKGAEFTIVDRTDVSLKLNILSATISASGTIVTLTTDLMQDGANYVVSGSSKISNAVGTPLVAGIGSKADLSAYKVTNTVPVVDYIASTSASEVEVEFRDAVRPSTVDRPGSIEIVEDGSDTKLSVKSVAFGEGNGIVITTANQIPDKKYRVVFKGVASAGGETPSSPQSKIFKGFKGTTAQRAALSNAADLNGDGKVDFTDFTMFSAVYGSVYSSGGTPSSGATQGLQPITPTPDSTVPVQTPVN